MQQTAAAHKTRQQGRDISLIETCVAGAVLSILLSQAIPTMQHFK